MAAIPMNLSSVNETYFQRNSTSGDRSQNEFIFHCAHIIIRFILSLIVISADVYLIVVITRYKKLKTRINMYLLNCFILDLIKYLIRPLIFLIFHIAIGERKVQFLLALLDLEKRKRGNDHRVVCLEMETQMSVLFVYLIFSFGLAIDYFITVYKPEWLPYYNSKYRSLFIGIYVAFFVEWSVLAGVCFNTASQRFRSIKIVARLFIYLIVATALITINVLKRRAKIQNEKTEYAFTAANIIGFSYIPIFIYDILMENFNLPIIVHLVLKYTKFIPEFIVIGHPMAVVYMLRNNMKYFKIAYERSFSRGSYGSKNLDEDSEAEMELREVSRKDSKLEK